MVDLTRLAGSALSTAATSVAGAAGGSAGLTAAMAASSLHTAGDWPILANRFVVLLNGAPMGLFQEVGGMGFEIAVETIEEGGENYSVHKVPGRITWPNLVLKNGWVASSVVVQWAMATSDAAFSGWTSVPTYTVTVLLYDESGAPVRAWSFVDAFPVSWRGPDLSAASDEVATEVLELAHHGMGPSV